MLYLCFQHLCSSLRKFVAYVTFSRCFSRGRGVSTPRSVSHRRGPRDTLHLTRHNRAQTRQTVAPGAVSAQKPTPPPHQLHPTRQNQAQTRKIVAPSAVGSTKPADTRHRLHPTRHNQDQTRQTVAPSAAGSTKTNPTTTPTTPDATHPSSNTQNRRIRCSRCPKTLAGPPPKGEPASSTRSTPVAER